MTRLEINGLKAMEANLNLIGPTGTVKIMRASFRAALKPMVALMKALVPINLPDDNDYHLRDSIRIQLEKKRNRTTKVQYRVGPARETTSGESAYKIRGGLGKSIQAPNYAQIIENDQPFVRPGFDRTVAPMLRQFVVEMEKRLAKELKKIKLPKR